MPEIKTFQKTWEEMEKYKESIYKAIKVSKENNLLEEKIINWLEKKLENDLKNKEFIKRNDLLNFWDNLEQIAKNKNLLDTFIERKKTIQKEDKNILEQIFEIITLAQSLINLSKEEEKRKEKERKHQEKMQQLKKEEEKEKEELNNLYNKLENL